MPFTTQRLGNLLSDLSYGLASQPNWQKGLASAFDRSAQMQPYRDQQQLAAEQKSRLEQSTNQTVAWLKQLGANDPYYAQLAAGVESRSVDPGAAFTAAMARQYPKTEPFTLGAGETRYGPDGKPIASAGPKPPDPNDAFNIESGLFNQYSNAAPLKAYEEVKAGYERVRQSATANTGAGDVAMVYGYMKMLDPGSVVREGEFATAEQTAGIPQQIVGLYNKLLSGQRLTPEQRQQFVQMSDALYQETAANLTTLNDQFSQRAQGWQVDPARFIRTPESFPAMTLSSGPRTTSTGVTWSR